MPLAEPRGAREGTSVFSAKGEVPVPIRTKRLGHGQRVVEKELEEVGAVDRSTAGSATISCSGTNSGCQRAGSQVAAVKSSGSAGGAVDFEGAVRIPVNRAELHVPQGSWRRE